METIMTDFNTLFQNTTSLTAQRKDYAMNALDQAIRNLATDLYHQRTKRDVGVHAVASLVAGYVPNSGEGHAQKVRSMVEQQVDVYLQQIEENTPKTKKEKEDS
jgi:hypothetical protein